MVIDSLIDTLAMPNTLTPREDLIVGGQPSEQDFHVLKKLGVRQVLKLRPEAEKVAYNQPALMQELGFSYAVIPVTEIDSFTKKTAQTLYDVIELGEPTLVHCASGNRVGALFALMAYWIENHSAKDSYEIGLQAGLTKLAPDIRRVLAIE